MRKYIVCLMGLVMVLGMTGLSSAAIVTDPTGDKIGTGPTDITAAQVEQSVPVAGIDVIKVSYTATPNIGGLVVFEADVDSSTGTGGNLSMTGIPVPPLNTQGKVTPGIDVAIIYMIRNQGPASTSAVCTGLPEARTRRFGEWYCIASGLGTTDTIGPLRGFSDPTPNPTATSISMTFPWANILANVNYEAEFAGEGFDYTTALNLATTKWQLSVWTDPNYSTDPQKDDFADGQSYFNLSDVVPNGNGILANVDAGTNLTFCEGNFDFDLDVDGQDASRFKTDFGRGKLLNPCPTANYFY